MSDRAAHPRPAANAPYQEFWEGCREGVLRLQRCDSCAAHRYPPGPRCPECQSDATTWEAVSGLGVVLSYTWCHPPVLPAFADRVPYNAVVVALEEGPLMVSNVEEVTPAQLRIDLPLEVLFVEVEPGFTVPRFRPRPPPGFWGGRGWGTL